MGIAAFNSAALASAMVRASDACAARRLVRA